MTFLHDQKLLHHLDVKAGPWPAHGSAPGCPRRYFHIGRWLQNQNNRQSEQPSQERATKVVLESGPCFCCPVASSDEKHLTKSVPVPSYSACTGLGSGLGQTSLTAGDLKTQGWRCCCGVLTPVSVSQCQGVLSQYTL